MVVLRVSLAVWLTWATSFEAQQTIYFKKDHIYDTSGRELATATPLPADQTAPTAPSSLAYSALNPRSVQLSWSASTDNPGGSGLAGYKIYRGPIPVGTVGPASLTFTDDALQPGTQYTYTAVALDNAQNHSGPSNSVTFTTSANSASDNFNRPDGPLGPNWSGSAGGTSTIPVIRSNRAGTDSAFTSNRTARYSAITFASDQYSQIYLPGPLHLIAMAAVRMQTSADSYYAGGFDNNNFQGVNRCRIVKYTNGVPALLTVDVNCTITVGDTIKLEVQGNTLRLYQNGVLKLTTTDPGSPYTSGSPGFTFTFNQNNASVVDDWAGGNLSS
jgi:fibronectin type III domain protein